MATNLFECPFCCRKFRLPTDTVSERILCPHCTQVVDLPGIDKSSARSPRENQQSTNPASLETIVTECPNCSGAFQVLPSMLGQSVACPHCHSRLQIVSPDLPAESTEPPNAGEQVAPGPPLPAPEFDIPKPSRKAPPKTAESKPIAPVKPRNPLPLETSSKPVSGPDPAKIQTDFEPKSAAAPASTLLLPETLDPELAKLLPPRFMVPGALQKSATVSEGNKVLLPDEHGGFKAIDTSTRQINFSGQSVAITSLPDSTKRRRRQIRSIVLFTVCGLLLLLAFYWLSR